MDREDSQGNGPRPETSSSASQHRSRDLIPREYLRIIALWSLIPSYAIAGGLLGYGLDKWLGTEPWLMAIGLLLALVLAVRDVYRLRETL